MYPEEFLKRMKELLKDDYDAFLQSLDEERFQALRLNPGKMGFSKDGEESLLKIVEASCNHPLKQVPWEKKGFYYEKEDTPGKHYLHDAGAYYIQEPSAMAPASYLEPQPGEMILDLCAAPGGKSTQIAAAMKGEGLLICNEIHPARCKILSENVERMGIKNACVLNETPQNLAKVFDECFDRIMVDAPCSGEGMFRKNDAACQEWSEENVKVCADRDDEILECVHKMLKPGGRMVFSTCTFAIEEDEGAIVRFMGRHKEYHIVKVKPVGGIAKGFLIDPRVETQDTLRLFPHLLQGEGHYVAVLEKGIEDDWEEKPGYKNCKFLSEKDEKEFLAFEKEYLDWNRKGGFLAFGDQLYLAPEILPDLKGLKVLRPGLHLGTLKKNRFEPSHALALALTPEDVKPGVCLEMAEADVKKYLHGETFSGEGENGWRLLTIHQLSIGWGKLAGGIVKNHYPKGLRKQY